MCKLVAATVAVVMWCLSGCAVASDQPDTVVTFLAPNDRGAPARALWDDLLAGFRLRHPAIRVDLRLVPWADIDADAGNTSWTPPDLLITDSFATFARNGILYQAKDIVSDAVWADVQAVFADGAGIDGRRYGLPLFASTRMLFYNKDIFARAKVASPPHTWAELLTDARKITRGCGIAGYGMPLDPTAAPDEASVWTYGAGGSWNVATTLTLDTAADRAGVAQLQKMIDAGVTQDDPTGTDANGVLDAFVAGKLGMVEGPASLIGRLAAEHPGLQYATVQSPTRTGDPVAFGVVDYIVAFVNDTRKRQAVSTFLNYLYEPVNYTRLVRARGAIPVTVTGGVALRVDAATMAFAPSLSNPRFYPIANPKWPAARAAVGRAVVDVARGARPAEELARAQQTVQQS